MVDASWLLQSNTGTATATGITPTLPNPTQPGSTLVLMAAAANGIITPQGQAFDPPWFDDLPETSSTFFWRRANQPGGETSWVITGSISSTWAWYLQEWAGLSTVAQPDAMSGITGPGFVTAVGQQVNDLNVAGATLVPDVADFAGLACLCVSGSTSGGTAWPAGRSWSSPWNEIASVQVGDGTVGTHYWLLAAEAYPGASGALDVVLTWDITGGGGYTTKSVVMGAGCYQPAVPPQPADVLTS